MTPLGSPLGGGRTDGQSDTIGVEEFEGAGAPCLIGRRFVQNYAARFDRGGQSIDFLSLRAMTLQGIRVGFDRCHVFLD